MFTFIIVLIIVAVVFLVLAVLMQNSKGGGVSQMGGGATQVMGVKRTGDVLEKITWGLGIFILTMCLVSNMAIETGSNNGMTTKNVEKASQLKKVTTQQPKEQK